MNKDLFVDGKKYISAIRASKRIDYSSDYIGQLCRAGKVKGRLIGKTWYVELESLLEHRRAKKPRGRKKASSTSEKDSSASNSHKAPSFNYEGKAAGSFVSKIVPEQHADVTDLQKILEIKNAAIVYESDERETFPNIKRKEEPIPTFVRSEVVRESLVIFTALFMILSSGLYVLNQTSPLLADKALDNLSAVSQKEQELIASLERAAVDPVRSYVDKQLAAALFIENISRGFQSLKEFVNSKIFFASDYGTTKTTLSTDTDADSVEKGVEWTRLEIASRSTTPVFNIESLKRELREDVLNYIRINTPNSPVVAYSSPSINFEALRTAPVVTNIYQTITTQSDSDVDLLSRAIRRVTNGGSFTNPTIVGGTITDANFSGSANFFNLNFANATGTNATTTNFFSTNGTFASLFGEGAELTDLIFTRATGTSATTTNFFSTTASSTNFFSSLLSIGGDALVVDSTRRVGIGTDSPESDLDIRQRNNGDVILSVTRNTDAAPTGDFIQYLNAARDTILFRVDNSGNLLAGGIINSGSQTITSTSQPQLRVQYDASNELTVGVSSLGVSSFGFSGTTPRGIWIPSTNRTDSFQFQNSSGTSILNIDTQNERVGIGTDAPTEKLHVLGNLLVSGNSTTTNATTTNFFSNFASFNSAGIGTSSLDSTAILQLDSTSKGFLAPRMTTAERDLISSPATGLLLYNTTTNKYNVYNGSAWKSVGTTEVGGDVENGTEGSVLFVGASGLLSQDNSNFFWNNTNKRLGIGTASPEEKLHISGNLLVTGNSTTTNATTTNFFSTTASSTNLFATAANLGALTAGSLNVATSVTSPSFIGALTGNASTATALQTARTIWGQSFDGTANVSGALSGATTGTFSTSLSSPLYTASGALAIRPGSNSTTAIQLQNAAGTNILNVDTTNSRIGIGTAAPTGQLTVLGSSAGAEIKSLVLQNSNASPGSNDAVSIIMAGTNSTTYDDGVNGVTKLLSTRQSDASSDFSILVSPGGSGSATSRFYIDGSTGNVGIGDSTPAALLTVGNGDLFQVSSTGNTLLAAEGRYTSGSGTSYYMELMNTSWGQGINLLSNATYSGSGDPLNNMTYKVNAGSFNTGAGLFRFDGNSKTWSIRAAGTSPGAGSAITWTQMANFTLNSNIWLSTRGTNTDFYITSGGSVGVGTNNPSGMFAVGATSQFQVSSAGAVTAVGVNAGAGLLQGTGGLTLSGATSINTSGSSNTNIGTGTNSGTITIGNSSTSDLALSDPHWSITGAGVATFTSVNLSGTGAFDSLTVGGGYGSTGVTISSAGEYSGNGNITLNKAAPQISLINSNLSGREWQVRNGAAGTTIFDIYDATAGISRFKIDSFGKASIGNASPLNEAMLFVYGDTTNGANVDLRASTDSTPATIEVQSHDFETSLKSAYLQYNGSGAAGNIIDSIARADAAILTFQQADNAIIYTDNSAPIVFGTNNNERMRITGSGNIGIGTTDPGAYKLNVNGNTNITGSATITNGLTISEGGLDSTITTSRLIQSDHGLRMLRSNGGATLELHQYQPTTVNDSLGLVEFYGLGSLGNVVDADASARIYAVAEQTFDALGRGSVRLAFDTRPVNTVDGAYERMTLTGAGNLGVGTSTPTARIQAVSTTEQMRLGYNASNYFSSTVGSTGGVTFDAVGSGAGFTFQDAVTLNGDASGSGAATLASFTQLGSQIGRIRITSYGANLNYEGYGFGSINNNFALVTDSFTMANGFHQKWSSSSVEYGTPDVGLARNAAGVLRVTDGSTGTGGLLTGAITSGLINGQTISSAANFTGTVAVTTSVSSPIYTGAGSVAIRPGSNSTTAVQIQNAAGTNILNVDTTNSRVGIGTASPAVGLQVVSTNGLQYLSDTLTDATNKFARFALPHYTNSEEPTALIFGQSTASSNSLAFGGGSALFNAATSLAFYTAADNTTTTGTLRMFISSTGSVGIGDSTSPSARLHVRLDGTGLQQNTYLHNNTTAATNLGSALTFLGEGSAAMASVMGRWEGAATTDAYLSFSTRGSSSNSEKMRISSAGNVGIGTTGPDRKLDVLDASNPQFRLTHTDGSVYTDFQTTSAGHLSITPSGGNVGIGITPTERLHILGPSVADANYSIIGLLEGAGSATQMGVLQLKSYRSSTASLQHFALQSWQRGAVGTTPTSLVLQPDGGKVGIGTNSPSVELEISKATGSATIDPTALKIRSTTSAGDFDTNNPWGVLQFHSNDGSGAGNTVRAQVGAKMANTAGSLVDLLFYTSNSTSLFEAARINSAGNLLVGITGNASFSGVTLGYGTETTQINAGRTTAGEASIGAYTNDGTNNSRIKFFTDNTAGIWGLLRHRGNGNQDFVIANTNSEQMRITQAGRVGIAASSPNSLLQIGSDATNTAAMVLLGKTQDASENNFPRIHQASVRTPGTTSDMAIGAASSGGSIYFYTGNITGQTSLLGTNSSTAKMVVYHNGNVGIGDATPAALLTVGDGDLFQVSSAGAITGTSLALGSGAITTTGSISSGTITSTFSNSSTSIISGNSLYVGNTDTTTNNYAALSFFTNSTGGLASIGSAIGMQTTARGLAAITSDLVFMTANNSDTPAERMRIKANGTVNILSLVSCGGIQTNASGAMSCTSDSNLKDVHGSFTAGLSAIDLISPQTYSWRAGSDMYDGGVSYSGFIAQNIEVALPNAVNTGAGGYKQINTTTILAAAVNAIKELKVISDETNQYASSTRMIVDGLALDVLSSTDDISELEIAMTGLDERVSVVEIRLSEIESMIASSTGMTLDLESEEVRQSIVALVLEAIGAVFEDGWLKIKQVAIETLKIGSSEKPSGITFYDEDTGEPYCVKIKSGALVHIPGECGAEQVPVVEESNPVSEPVNEELSETATSTEPVIEETTQESLTEGAAQEPASSEPSPTPEPAPEPVEESQNIIEE